MRKEETKKNIKKDVLLDYIKATSCAFSMTLNLSKALGIEPDPLLLSSVIGFSAGVSAMGDTCGTPNGGIVALGGKYADTGTLDSSRFYMVCSEYFRRLEKRLDTPDCGKVHGGKHLANNFRRAILTGKPLKCMEILWHGTEVITELDQETENRNSFSDLPEYPYIDRMTRYFEQEAFHCSQTVIQNIADKTGKDMGLIDSPSKGFAGGIGFNGTFCGAISGGVLSLGLIAGVDLRSAGYYDAFKTIMVGLAISDGIFSSEKHFPGAKLFGQCKKVYKLIEDKFGGVHCKDILQLQLNTDEGSKEYIKTNKIEHCRKVVQTVTDTVINIWED